MKKLLISALTAMSLVGSAAFAEPVKMSDADLSAVTAGAAPRFASASVRISNLATALNIIRTDSGSASATCVIGCIALNIAILSGNILIFNSSQTAIASAGRH